MAAIVMSSSSTIAPALSSSSHKCCYLHNNNHKQTSSSSSSSLFLSPSPSFSSTKQQNPFLSLSPPPRSYHHRSVVVEASSSLRSSSSRKDSFAKLYISGLSFRTTEESLRNAFERFGELEEVNLVMDRIANRPKGFAFIRYGTEEESKKAIEGMHGKFLDGRVIFVEVAKPRSELKQSPGRRY